MKNKKNLFLIIALAIGVLLVAFLIFIFFKDENKLSREEKNWISDNLNVVQNIGVVNNANVFGDNGTGVFYDFIRDFQTEYRIEINPVTFLLGEDYSGINFNAGNMVNSGSTIFYEDHYVIVGKEKELHASISDFNGKVIGVLSSDEQYLRKYLQNYTFKPSDNVASLFESLKNDDVSYVLVPLNRDIDKIVSNKYNIEYHLSDIKYYYYFDGIKGDKLSSIVNKFFNNWKEKYMSEILNQNMFSTYTTYLGLTDADISNIQAVNYKYGFVNQSPYEVITGGNFGGIVAVYLKRFSDFANVDINFKKYKNYDKFAKAVDNKEIDIFYNYYATENKMNTVHSYENIEYSIIAPSKNRLIVNDLRSLDNTDVYVLKNSLIAKYFADNYDYNLKFYDSQSDLQKIARKGNIIIIDSKIFNYFHTNKLSNYETRYNGYISAAYNFKVKEDGAFLSLLETYINTLDPKEVTMDGIHNHSNAVQKGDVLANIAKYLICALALFVLFFYLFYKKSKKVTIAKKIRNDEKIKYIDLLTSLKNRNYLSENMEVWNNNKIYPQTMIVLDLNNIAYLNDTKGYEAGDRQITALANILIKTQLDNSDIMRTNGNEFLVYLVGYEQKQIVNYIHKLTKEMKKLPYEYGAAIGYSMINDDIKTIEDAINEALEDMKKQKEKIKEVRN